MCEAVGLVSMVMECAQATPLSHTTKRTEQVDVFFVCVFFGVFVGPLGTEQVEMSSP